jgi:hypothetical protein
VVRSSSGIPEGIVLHRKTSEGRSGACVVAGERDKPGEGVRGLKDIGDFEFGVSGSEVESKRLPLCIAQREES